ncbi:endo alpha-1,4 polygalactosaminidase [Alkalicoccus urumqiensis]|uniref:Glycosyl hydrolase n=1 Tax=Alkalicoccus urumqiensis TaxID=1548213 RepID=A0A2P6MLA2_ALKUR|nr:endo alpha-1,4 polygalactosaminidase [Alkalicoccus urumqiensis]PRO67059.1 glycosyl hydrolase [Alkalicoccus urumqiensis]
MKTMISILALLAVAAAVIVMENPAYGGDFRIYYNNPSEETLEQMAGADEVILEPVHYSREDIEFLQSSGVRVLGYINIMEIDRWNEERFNSLEEGDFFLRNGERVYYPQWDSYLTDLTSENYRNIVKADIEEQILNKGLDGILFDTVGNIDNEFARGSDTYEEQLRGLIDIYEFANEAGPDLHLVQNWGLDLYIHETAPYVDGLMWEEFHYSKLTTDNWSEERLDLVAAAAAEENDDIYSVIFDEPKRSAALAEERDFRYLYTDQSYLEW